MTIWYKVVEEGTWTKVEIDVTGNSQQISDCLDEIVEAGISLPRPKETLEITDTRMSKKYDVELSEEQMRKLRGIGRDELTLCMRLPSRSGYGRINIAGIEYDSKLGNCGVREPIVGPCHQPIYERNACGGIIPPSMLPPRQC